jgi:hypothetical protein
LQDLQAPVHAVAQQAPCAHIPDTHSPFAVQTAPLVLRPQLPALQTDGDLQVLLALQLVAHLVPSHT